MTCDTTANEIGIYFQSPTMCGYNVPLHVWEIGLLLLQDSDCETVSQQNYDHLTQWRIQKF